MMKKLQAFISAALAMVVLTSGAAADRHYNDNGMNSPEYYEAYYDYLMKAVNGTITDREFSDELVGDGDVEILPIPNAEQVEYFNGNYAVSFNVGLDRIKQKYRSYPDFQFYVEFELNISPVLFCTCTVDVADNPIVSTAELRELAGVKSDEKITAVRMRENVQFNNDVRENYFEEFAVMRCTRYTDSVDYINLSDKGWHKIDGKYYYVKPDGTLATRSTTINGIRCKFDVNGVYSGKYTGWTKSSDGAYYYWRNGVKKTGLKQSRERNIT